MPRPSRLKKITVGLLVPVIVLIAVTATAQEKKVTLTGVLEDGVGGYVLRVKDDVYRLEGARMPDELLGRTIKVTGVATREPDGSLFLVVKDFQRPGNK
ncbi:MAG: DUF5818 domain-containing protein [Thermodesulfobacteriota bacterium]